jgi:hypothetical protein
MLNDSSLGRGDFQMLREYMPEIHIGISKITTESKLAKMQKMQKAK